MGDELGVTRMNDLRILNKGGKMMRWFGCLAVILLFVISGPVAAYDVTAPTEVTRGGVITVGADDNNKIVDGTFPINITGESGLENYQWTMGFLTNPQKMTGGYCDRPPAIDDDLGINPTMVFDPQSGSVHPIGNTAVLSKTNGQFFHGTSFLQLVPNGQTYPSDHPDLVYKMGTRYYGLANGSNSDTVNSIVIDTLYRDGSDWEEMSVKPGTYNFHLQGESGTDDTIFDNEITVNYGELTLQATPLFQNVFALSGKNTDSKKTYLWITGGNLPECGASLSYQYSQPVSGVPSVIGNYTVNGIISDIAVDYAADGTWEADWFIPPTLQPGNYTIWASSVDPSTIPNLSAGVWKSTKGVCGLQCAICAPPFAKVEIEVAPWTMSDPVIENSSVVLDCSDSVCSPNLTYPKVVVKGDLYINPGSSFPNGLPLQIWVFGPNKVGDQEFIFTNKVRTFPDDTSSYEIDITKYLLDQGVSVCDLESGEYKVIIQMTGFDSGYLVPEFDITHERAITPDGRPVFDPNHWYIVSSHPYSKFPIEFSLPFTLQNPGWIPAFPVEGSGAIGGMNAYHMLIDLLNQDFVRDQYKVVSFTVTNNMNGGSVDFVGTPTEGYQPLSVQFVDTSSYTGDTYSWSFGDGSVSNETNPVHVYDTPGYYDVSLGISNGTANRSVTKSAYISVKERTPGYKTPRASFTYLSMDKYRKTNDLMTLRFIDQSSGSTPLTYLWNFGDNSTSDIQNPNHTYSETDTYNVSLQVSDTYGVTSTATQSIILPINGPNLTPDFSVTPEMGNPPLAVQITDKSIIYPENMNVSYSWTIDGVSYENPPVVKNPLFAGVHLINLTLTGPDGLTNSTFQEVRVENLVASFTNATNGTTITLTDSSQGFPTNWLWSIRDESGVNQLFTDRKQNTEVSLRKAGTYQVTLTCWNDWNKASETESVVLQL